MAGWLYKWLFLVLWFGLPVSVHPVYVSVVEIEHNAAEKRLEISCKIFTDDLEKELRIEGNANVDLLTKNNKAAMDLLVRKYILRHFSIAADGKAVQLNYLGYEQQEEGIVAYLQVDTLINIKKLAVTDNILYEYAREQMGIIHITVNGIRKSYKLNNPEDKAFFEF